MRKWFKPALLLLLVPIMAAAFTFPAFASANYGAGTVRGDQTYSLEQMLTIAMQDEYLAGARYKAVISKFGRQRPFINIEASERTHAMALKSLFRKHDIPVPENAAAQYVTVPGTLVEAIKDAINSERLTVHMYDIFLSHNLPNDVKLTFTFVRNAAENHVEAFERVIARTESVTRR
ncbi:MAG: hypothetical protein GX111_06800 [Clostridiales bacterium]|jgi:hypothetical protein|nr:hypothetical protein [Clostridiales bacterium]